MLFRLASPQFPHHAGNSVHLSARGRVDAGHKERQAEVPERVCRGREENQAEGRSKDAGPSRQVDDAAGQMYGFRVARTMP